MKKLVRAAVSLLLVLCMTALLIPQISAIGQKTYISDLRIAYATTDADARKQLTDAGYKVIEQNLNQDADDVFSRKRYVYMGYKTTTDATNAITDVAMMSEECGYSFADYQSLLKENYSSFETLAAYEMDLLEAYRAAYKAGKPLAINAYYTLNNFIEEDTVAYVGDFLLDENLKTEKLISFMTQMTQCMLFSYNQLLVSAAAEDSTDTVLTRLSAMSTEDITAAKADKTLFDSAMVIYNALPAFRNAIKSAEGAADAKKTVATEASMSIAERVAAAKTYYGANKEKFGEDLNALKEAAVLNMLKGTVYGGTTLYDVIMNESVQVQELYPLVSAMNKSQIAGVKLAGMFEVFSVIGTADAAGYTEAEVRAAHEHDNGVKYSSYYGVDRAMFSDNVAITSEATREMNSTGDKSALWGNISSNAEIGLAIAAGVAAGISVASFITTAIISTAWAGDEVTYLQALLDAIGPRAAINNFTERFFDNVAASTPYTVQCVAGVVMYAALIVAVIISVTLLVIELVNHYNLDYSRVPDIMLDLRVKDSAKSYIKYNVVKTPDNSTAGDLNGYAGLKWNAVYTTKDSSAGKPLLAKTMAFTDKTNPGSQFTGLHEFGSDTSVNLNNHAYNDKTEIHLYFAPDKSYSAETGSVFGSSASLSAVTGAAGIIIGAAITFFVMRKKKKAPAAAA